MMEIEVSKLKEIAIELLNDLKLNGKGEIPLDEDYYWVIPEDQVYNPQQDPARLVLGQLYDDYDMLINAKNEGDLICYHLKYLASLLRYIADRKCS